MTTNFIPSFKKQAGDVIESHTKDDFILKELVPLSCLFERNSKWMIEIDLPGVDKKDIKVTVTKGHVVVKAKLEESYKVSSHGHVATFESLKKAVEIPPHADIRKISAKFRNGILVITIPKIEFGKRIPVR
ncbi:MAG: Hsp20/alpha crystallin family protein [Thaumarchaeota archaeon]|nr:Hsp20/alpha crystallin family protein [Nitrososphaerota archaeon]